MSALTPIKPEHGSLVMQPLQLKAAASKAVKEGSFPRATHIYTLAIDLLMKSHEDGEPNWFSLDTASDGLLHILLSNRSFTHFKCQDYLAAAEDAQHCTLASPQFVKGYLRLIAAISANDANDANVATTSPATNSTTEKKQKQKQNTTASFEERVRIVSRGLRACGPRTKPLIMAREALVKESTAEQVMAIEAAEFQVLKEQMDAVKCIADDTTDTRRVVAAGDYGSALALGAHGLEKNETLAEVYLKIASDGGDSASAKNYGHLLLSLKRAGEASEQFARAANLGDTEAADILRSLSSEADQKRDEAMNKLRQLADSGNERAIEMLKQFQSPSVVAAGLASGSPP